ncbi:hypothetical protein [Elizabethkingia anophelis]|uniref:hypothetical protein n=1 Tax=Elizabethkingia anophelis TaxID=1117645 RepID=UPI002406F45E|nr:hypothetical protein [Elizabethkingia anophelis]
MENKLIPMTDFVLQEFKRWENKETPDYQSTGKYVLGTKIYASFLKQPLTLGMFIPVDENNVPLEFIEYEAWTGSDEEYNEYTHKYFEAKNKVLFEGFEIEQSKSRIGFYLPEYNCIDYSIVQNNFSSPSKWLTTIEDLIIYSGLILTATAIKSISGS